MIIIGDALLELKKLKSNSIDCIVTSPPYWGLRDYDIKGQIGLEKTPQQYINKIVDIFLEAKRVLKPTGTLWLNLGDSYSGGKKTSKPLTSKDIVGIPWKIAFALQQNGWILRQDIIWHKPNPMPESVRDRCTRSHEYIFLFTKNKQYFFDIESIKESSIMFAKGRARPRIKPNGTSPEDLKKLKLPSECQVTPLRQKRSVWSVTTKSYSGAHCATFPPDLIEPCIKAGTPVGGTVLDPFFGAGTVGLVAERLALSWVGIEINPEYARIAEERINK